MDGCVFMANGTPDLYCCVPLCMCRPAGPLTVVVSTTGLDRAWAGAWVLLRKFLEYLLEITQEHERGRVGGGRGRRGGGGRVGNGHCHHHVGAAGWQQRQRQRWMPGRRVAAFAFLTLLASYRRYQVRPLCVCKVVMPVCEWFLAFNTPGVP